MATPSTRATTKATPAPETETAETGTEVETTSVEQDVAETHPEQNAEALAAAEPVADPRESALAALLSGETAEPVITPADEPAIDTSNVVDFGGRSKAVVLFSRYNQFVDGKFKQARKGTVIATTAEDLKRGVRVGALKKLEG